MNTWGRLIRFGGMGLVMSGLSLADVPKSLPSFKGAVISSFTHQTPVTLNPGGSYNCATSDGPDSSYQTRYWKCTTQGAGFEISRASGSAIRISVPDFGVIEHLNATKGRILRSYYYKGTWSESVHGVNINSSVVFAVNEIVADQPTYRGYITAPDLNLSEQVILTPTN